ncbi:hypothetical protein AAC387_Pa02g4796 [Persea americana]
MSVEGRTACKCDEGQACMQGYCPIQQMEVRFYSFHFSTLVYQLKDAQNGSSDDSLPGWINRSHRLYRARHRVFSISNGWRGISWVSSFLVSACNAELIEEFLP